MAVRIQVPFRFGGYRFSMAVAVRDGGPGMKGGPEILRMWGSEIGAVSWYASGSAGIVAGMDTTDNQTPDVVAQITEALAGGWDEADARDAGNYLKGLVTRLVRQAAAQAWDEGHMHADNGGDEEDNPYR